MFVSEISLWGTALVALLVLIAAIALAFFDGKMLRRLSVCWCLYPIRNMWKKLLWPVSAAMLVGCIVAGGCAMLCLPPKAFMSVYSVLMACLTAAMIQTLMNYQRNLHNPEPHKPMMPESILPQVRLMAQPLVMVMPMLYAGMLIGGIPPLRALVVVLLLIAVTFVANVLSCVVALLMLRRQASRNSER